MSTIIGIVATSFTPKDASDPITGETLYITEPIDPKRGMGHTADRLFLSTAKLGSLDFAPAVGQEVEVYYNKFGKVGTLKLLADPDAPLDID